ncbi:YidC/Oxa1 family membrane protein insertase [Lachnospira multipara]|uniref:YidC/Oxa1 family membrane protein insertase n=1 Tax=Lachnospira multipara TaxID=28051 RepID=A0A1H5U7I8_9FIRM|nr:YidC/Oxa1 family membrane protein insertase [Lachnospira multipara]SEF71016.1 YidC/Oxa1 family membrane protein insertase [Lachnospira multipara]
MNNIIQPIATFLGAILDILYKGLDVIGIGNVAIAIVVFTLLVKLLMLPLTVKQQKMSKLTSIMNPEIKEIQNKYKDKRGDQDAMLKMQAETKAVYEKYGVSQWGSCVQLLIQMPILFALYQVFQKIPLYISSIKVLFTNILGNGSTGLSSIDGYQDTLSSIASNVDWSSTKAAIVGLNSFSADQWNQLKDAFPSMAPLITENYDKIKQVNTFLGVNMSQAPGFSLSLPILIPILAGVTQFISVKVSQAGMSQATDDDNPAAASMKMMTLFMPIMSAFIAISVPAGLGLYWIATAVIQTIMYICINRYYDKIGTDAIVQKNIEKRNKKRAKQGLPAETITKNAKVSAKKVTTEDRVRNLQAKKDANDKKIADLKAAAKNVNHSKAGSLASKANMVSEYNESNKK